MSDITEKELAALYEEREKITTYLAPPPADPWKKAAQKRLEEIDKQLVPHFFPKPKDEGTQRKTIGGFVVMLKTGLTRTIDQEALPAVLSKCPKGTEDKCVTWKATLELKEYRKLSEKTLAILDGAIILKPAKAEFEIVKQPD